MPNHVKVPKTAGRYGPRSGPVPTHTPSNGGQAVGKASVDFGRRPGIYRLRLPGPTTVPEAVRVAIAEPMISHRGAEFRHILVETTRQLQAIFGTKNTPLLFACSGTGMMEAALVNVLAPGERLLIINNGQWGERFAAIAAAMGARVDTIDVPWGKDADPAAVEARLATANYRALVHVHNESSTGAVGNLAAIGRLTRDLATLFITDTVSGLGGVEMQQDQWSVDVAVSASQKCLMCPPGLGLASISAKAWPIVRRTGGAGRFYLDFCRAADAWAKGETAFTPPVSLIRGLNVALRTIHAEGLPNVLARHGRLANALRLGVNALGIETFTEATHLSNSVSVFRVPKGLDGKMIVKRLADKHGTIIAGARNKLDGKVIRIATMGCIEAGDILTDLHHLEDVLVELGWPIERGSGVAAAAAAL
jgi:aspartate aminotransferase-like enzyme